MPLSRSVRRAARLARLTVHLVAGVLLTFVFPWLAPSRRRVIVRAWSARLLRILAVSVEARGHVPAATGAPAIFASNHVSWLDIFVIDSLRTTCFVAKSEVRSWPVLGWLSAKTGTLFIERGRRHAAAAVNREIVDAVARGDTIGLFPEGTTTFGNELRPFHSALFQAAIGCGAPLHPVALRYFDADGTPSRAATYVGDQTFVDSLWQITGAESIRVEVEFGAAIVTEGSDRRTISGAAEAAITRMLCLPDRRRTPDTASDLAA